LLGVLGTGARISVDILELGSYLVGREERFWAVFYGAAAVKKASDDKRRDISIRFRYFKFCIVLIYDKILLLLKNL
jgi:hypothetical protein